MREEYEAQRREIIHQGSHNLVSRIETQVHVTRLISNYDGIIASWLHFCYLFVNHCDLPKKGKGITQKVLACCSCIPSCRKCLYQVWQQLSLFDISLGSCQRPTLGNDKFNEEKPNLPPELLALQVRLTSDRLGGTHCRE